jgi:hypothetical protein
MIVRALDGGIGRVGDFLGWYISDGVVSRRF